jgi:hypothetical protein
VHPVVVQREQHLAGTAEIFESPEHEPDDFLEPQVPAQPAASVATPQTAERHRDTKFAPTGFRTGRLHEAAPEDTQLRLADGHLPARQDPVVGMARIAETIEVELAGVHQTAQLEQVMPVGSPERREAGSARGEREDRPADRRGASGCMRLRPASTPGAR